jgi:hypothetical protein
MNKMWPLDPVSLGFLAFAVAILFYGLVCLVDSWNAASGAYRTTGTVIGFRPGPRWTYAPVVSYEVDCELYELVARVSSRPGVYTIGDAVVVCYHPERPAEGRLDSFGELWLFPTIFLVLGTLFATLGWTSQIFGVERRNKSKLAIDELYKKCTERHRSSMPT